MESTIKIADLDGKVYMPVSYTQLYHQIQNYLLGHFKLDKKYEKEKIYGIVVVLEDAVVSRKRVYVKAVSYTHLDVYKRQGKLNSIM